MDNALGVGGPTCIILVDMWLIMQFPKYQKAGQDLHKKTDKEKRKTRNEVKV